MAQLVSDPSLQVYAAQATDLLVLWRPNANLPLGGSAVTIAVQDFFLSMASTWLTPWFAALPTTAPAQGWWRDGASLQYAGDPTSAPSIPGGISTAQFRTAYEAYRATLPTIDPGDGTSDWNNNGIITQSIASTGS